MGFESAAKDGQNFLTVLKNCFHFASHSSAGEISTTSLKELQYEDEVGVIGLPTTCGSVVPNI